MAEQVVRVNGFSIRIRDTFGHDHATPSDFTPSGSNSPVSLPTHSKEDPKDSKGPNGSFPSQFPTTDRFFYFLENKVGTDVGFMVGEGGGQTMVHAHKLILASASQVFFSMFFGGLGGNDDGVIHIPDCEPESFRLAIEYIYRGTLPLMTALDKASDMIYIARKYFLQPLEEELINQLKTQIQPDMVIEILRIAHVYDLVPLRDASWEYIAQNPAQVLEMSGASIHLDLLTSILRLPQLNSTEINLFLAAKEWAMGVISRNPTTSSDTTGLDIRKTLGDALRLIRFETMGAEEIAQEVAPTGILTMSEIGSIFISMNTPEDATAPAPVLFNNVPRGRPPGGIPQINKSFFANWAFGTTGTEPEFLNTRANRRSRRRSATAARRHQNLV